MRVHPNLTGMLLLVGLSGCHVTTVESRPLAGPTPQRVAVWPVADEPVLLAGLDDALRGRGYTIVSTAVARQLLADAALLPPDTRAPRGAEVSAVGAALGADALLELEVSRFEASAGEFREARWDLTWRLVAARDGAVVWDYEHAGAWTRAGEQPFDPLTRLDAPAGVIPFGRPSNWAFRDAAELAANLHRLALAHLPRGGG